MTPNPMGPNSPTAAFQGGSPALYQNISSMGAQPEQAENVENAQPVGQNDQSDKLSKRFGIIFQMFRDLAKEFPGGEEEVNSVQNGLGNWLTKAQAQVNEGNNTSAY